MLEHMDDPSIDEPIPSDGLYIPAPAAALIHQPPVELECVFAANPMEKTFLTPLLRQIAKL
jgi:hypothetical protein